MQIVTANRLIDGRVVFRTAAGAWVEAITAAAVIDVAAATEAVKASAADVEARLIVDPYAVDMVESAEGLTPKSMREKIRAGGPTSGSEVAALEALSRAA